MSAMMIVAMMVSKMRKSPIWLRTFSTDPFSNRFALLVRSVDRHIRPASDDFRDRFCIGRMFKRYSTALMDGRAIAGSWPD
jgi:hypothetical protein